MKTKKKPRSNRVASDDGLKRLFEVCDGGYLKGPSIDTLLETPKAQRQLAAIEKLISYQPRSTSHEICS